MNEELPEIEGQMAIGEDGEVIVAEIVGDEDESSSSDLRTIRVYDKARGDFTIEIPRRSTVTFGYFNPAAPKYDAQQGGYGARPSEVARATAMRIYETGPKSSQLACFLDVQGFRDLSLKLTRLRQRVVIESNFEDDGDGNRNWGRNEQRMLRAASEDAADDIPF